MWVVLFAAVVYHEAACAEGELLSEGVDRALQKYAVPIYAFTAITVAHLLNWLPKQVDPYTTVDRKINER